MLTRIIENLLVLAFNGLRDRVLRHRAKQRTTPTENAVAVGLEKPLLSAKGHIAAEKPPVLLHLADRMRHVYLIGATGSGKTNFLMNLIQGDISCGHTICVLDLRGDLVDRILLRLAASGPSEVIGQRLLLFDLRDDKFVIPFNPLLGEGDIYNRALYTLEILQKQASSWGVQLEETLRNSLIALTEGGWSLAEIEPLLCNSIFRAKVVQGVSDQSVQSFFERYNRLSEDKQNDWRLPVLNKVTPFLAIPKLRAVLGQKATLPLSRLLNEQRGSVILVSLAVDQLHQAAHLVGSLFISSLQHTIMARANMPETERWPVLLYVDEFEALATERFETIVAEGRRFGLGLCLSHQNLTQLPTTLKNTVRNNVRTQLFFQTGATDAGDLAHEIITNAPLSEVRETLMSLPVGEAFLVRRGEKPTRLRVPYAQDPKVSPAELASLRATSVSQYAQPIADVLAEIDQRGLLENSENVASEKPKRKRYEVRHERSIQPNPNDSQPI
jgi:hypothetical protein